MPFYCVLCANEEESCYWGNFCSKCIKLKKVIDLYGIDNINDTLDTVYLRDKDKVEKRANVLKNNDGVKTRQMCKTKQEKK